MPLDQLLQSTIIVVILALTPAALLESNHTILYEHISFESYNDTGMFYLKAYIRLGDCKNISDIIAIKINNLDLTNFSLYSRAITLDNCSITLNTRLLGIYGLLEYNTTIVLILEVDNRTTSISIYIPDPSSPPDSNDHTTGVTYSSSNLTSAMSDVKAYYNSDSPPLDYKRVIILFVLLVLSVTALVREYGH